MSNLILQHEMLVRLGSFFGVFLLMALWEVLAPKRSLNASKPKRWAANLGITATGTLAVRYLFSAGATGFAILAQEKGWGVLALIEAPYWLKVLGAFLVLDFAIYMQHMVFHHLPLFWRLHMMHHADLDIDLTTGARFHPVEILLSMGIKIGVIFLIGAPVLAVLAFEVILNASAMFNHSNVRMPAGLDKVLRLFLVTPDMHRVHHSVIIKEFNSNFGFCLPWWDRLMGTYRAAPLKGHQGMTIGLAKFREEDKLQYLALLAMPFGKEIQRNS
ncbi:sterol desaturase family protein [Desulfatibacillum aliphaticivorans]|uniref:sterol desaturase family protein n=1 Tax=Desulfatibacillum aliphaticivorans TaxID=218208 RepID=UPI0003FEE3A9|nr:sterol desaturase family protein [Desulfatibacillum aliphaticivorans]